MSWFHRVREGILTSTDEKIDVPDGLWHQCPSCKKPSHIKELNQSLWVCPHCDHHLPLDSAGYFTILFDEGKHTELDADLQSADPLEFVDRKPYPKRIKEAQSKTGLKDAVRTGYGPIHGREVMVACMDFRFIGGSMGSVVGEKIARAIEAARQKQLPLIIISKSGGARMMEGALSLMQMAKTSARLAQFAEAGLPYISLMTDPTTGGVTASFAMLGDFNVAEPKALIGFAGPRVIRETIGKDLPEGFQRSEFLLDEGFLDMIIHRHDLKDKLATLLALSID